MTALVITVLFGIVAIGASFLIFILRRPDKEPRMEPKTGPVEPEKPIEPHRCSIPSKESPTRWMSPDIARLRDGWAIGTAFRCPECGKCWVKRQRLLDQIASIFDGSQTARWLRPLPWDRRTKKLLR